MSSTRRLLVLGSAALIGLPALSVRAQGRRRATPAQTEGPFYPVKLPQDDDFDLLRHGPHAPYAQGQPAWVEGTVADVDGRPLAGGVVEIWQCDADGHYRHPGDGDRIDPAFQGFGRVTLGADGRYRFRTLRPAPYGGRTPHIHFKVKLGRDELLTTQLYVEGEPRNARDGLWRSLRDPADRAALTRPFVAGADGLQAEFPIVVQT
jgi:protocatechuate 3,4-dioxygenase beta subunit